MLRLDDFRVNFFPNVNFIRTSSEDVILTLSFVDQDRSRDGPLADTLEPIG